MVSGAAVSAATLGPGQDGPSTDAAQVATQHRSAYHANSIWGPHQTNADDALQSDVTHTIAGKKRAAIKREEARERARKRARELAKKRAAEAAKKKREARASRSDSRAPANDSSGPVPSGSPKSIAKAMLADRGWSDQFGCLDSLWTKESGWQVDAANPSGAYGIPQALPGSKMSSAGPDWQNNAATQIKWGLGYISDRYGDPCSAWSHSQANNWY